MHLQDADGVVQNGELTFFSIILIFGRQKKFIAGLTIVVTAFAVITSLLVDPVFTATAKFLPPNPDQNVAALISGIDRISNLAGGLLGGKSSSDTFAEMAKSQNVQDTVVKKFDLMSLYETKTMADTYRILDKRVSLSVGKKDGIISLSVEDKSPVRAAQIANFYVEEIGRLAGRVSAAGAGSDRRFAEKNLAEAKIQLAQAEEVFKSFQQKNKSVHVTEQAKLTVRGVAELQAELALKEARLAAMKEAYTDSNPEVKAARASIAKIRSEIGMLEGNRGGGTIPSIGTVPQLEQDYLRLMRELKIREAVVDVLTKQYEMARISEAKLVSPVQLIQEASPPDKRTKPKRRKMVIVAFAVGFAFSLAAAVLVDYIQTMPDDDRKQWRKLRQAYFPVEGER